MAGAEPCWMCKCERERLAENELAFAIADGHPVGPGHALIITKRHVLDYFAATDEERAAIWRLLEDLRVILDARHAPAGWNVGFNAGVAAGQTVMHAHVHLIPRFVGDVEDPRGGVRGVIPSRQRY